MQRKIPALDGVRGVAILVVLAHNLHAFSSSPFSLLSDYGWLGVDLFFVLSGFLITGILLDTRPSEHFFRNFYARRCLRIWPLYYSVLLLMFVIVPLLRPHDALEIFRRSHPVWSYPFFLQNFFVPEPVSAVGPLGVSWSLAVEELFYLVWPLFVRYSPTRMLQTIAWVVLLGSPVLRLFFVTRHWLIYSNPFCRLDGLMAGALLALFVRTTTFRSPPLVKPAWILLLAPVPLGIVTERYNARWLTFSLAVVASAAFVYLAQFSGSVWLKAGLTNRFLVFTGTISYGLYLLHKLPEDGFKAVGWNLTHPVVDLCSTALASYLLAIISWNVLEIPFLRFKRFFESSSECTETNPAPQEIAKPQTT